MVKDNPDFINVDFHNAIKSLYNGKKIVCYISGKYYHYNPLENGTKNGVVKDSKGCYMTIEEIIHGLWYAESPKIDNDNNRNMIKLGTELRIGDVWKI